MEQWKIITPPLISLKILSLFLLLSCSHQKSLPPEIDTPEWIVKRGNFFNKKKEYAIVLKESNTKNAFIRDIDYPLYSLEILTKNKKIDTLFKIQGIPISSASINCEIEDYNFDNKNDIIITLYTSARGNNRKAIFLYNSNSNSFNYVPNSHLLPSLNINKLKQTVTSSFEFFNDSIGEYQTKNIEYRYNSKNKLYEIRE